MSSHYSEVTSQFGAASHGEENHSNSDDRKFGTQRRWVLSLIVASLYFSVEIEVTSPPNCSEMAMYIRVKRMKATYFIQCDPTEMVVSIKQKLQTMIDEPPSNQKLVLRSTHAVLSDSNTLAEQGVENDAIVELSLRQENSGFDEPDIILPGNSES